MRNSGATVRRLNGFPTAEGTAAQQEGVDVMNNSDEAKIGAGRLAAIYARASQPSERERTPVPEQLDACRVLAGELGYTVPDEARLSDNAPNTTLARPGMTILLTLVRTRRVGAVIVHTLDRLARPESKALEALLREFQRREMPLYVAKIPKGYRYDPVTGRLNHDVAEVAAASREEWRPPEYIIIPREDDRD